MKKLLLLLAIAQFANATYAQNWAKVRIKDVARLSGYENHTLLGYGIVIGLNGTGDSDAELIQKTMANTLNQFNIKISEDDIKANNIAAVMITAKIRGEANKGDLINATVSTIGDCSSLTGGELILTPVKGTDGTVWGTAQGAINNGGYAFGGTGEGGNKIIKNHPTVAMLTDSLKLSKDVRASWGNGDIITYHLNNPDFTAAVNFAQAVNDQFTCSSVAKNSSTIDVRIPKEYKDNGKIPRFISEVEQISFKSDQEARIVFNSKTGTIVIGAEVRLSAVALTHANLNIDIKNTEKVAIAPGILAPGAIEKVNDQKTTATEEVGIIRSIPTTTTIGDLVKSLNALEVPPRDIMIIFHTLREAGALHAKLESI